MFPSFGIDSRSHASRLARTSGAAALGLLLLGPVLPSTAAAKRDGPHDGHRFDHGQGKDQDACRQVAADTQRSCRASALDDYWLAVARCDNAGEDSSRPDSCKATAHEARHSDNQDCAEQLSARLDICQQLGGGSYAPQIDPADFSPDLTNPYLAFTVGKTFHYQTDLGGGDVETDDVTVTPDTREIAGVNCRAVHDVVRENGDVTEDTIDWYAQDGAGNVWYFGEESKQYEDGVLVSIEGSWMTGMDDAQPGIVMEANPTANDFYRQEFAVGVAEDVAKVVALGQSVTVPYLSTDNAAETEETSGLEPSALEHKYYESGVGQLLTVDEETGQREELISVTP